MTPETRQQALAGATLTYDGRELALPVVRGTEDEVALDIEKLRGATGAITLDPGFGNTGSCRSAITFIDGEKGILRYRGYPIDELAERSTFLEVAWLLINGELPNRAQLSAFTGDVTHHTLLHESFRRFFEALPKDAHPMPVCAAAVAALATFYQEPETDKKMSETAVRLIAKMPTLAAYSYKHSIGQPFMYPRNSLDYSATFLHMMFATPCEDGDPDPLLAKTLDLLLILHADHEQNCSTSTVRTVGSSGANLFASISAGISALWGPLHGGANQQVIEMLEKIEAEGGDVQVFVNRAKDKKDNSRLMGFGHRVYKNYDPRAQVLKRSCTEVLNRLGIRSRQLEIAMKLEEIALKDDYFISHKLYPNVDFYSGIIYKALGIPVNMFTVMFAIGRMPGWIAQWLEMRHDPATRIARPRQIYTGAVKRPYVEMERRGT
ncbi:MAG: citrate synthase [Candidatus Eisenbacteria bacterium]|nr:citrate synthase [Candidatus Eisenbacteria bacterium]